MRFPGIAVLQKRAPFQLSDRMSVLTCEDHWEPAADPNGGVQVMRKDDDDIRRLIFAWIISAIVFVVILLLWKVLL
jgi:hypothetical protein